MARPKYVRIEVKDKGEADAITVALTDPATRAFVVIVGSLLPFGDRARTRILNFVNDSLDDGAGRLTVESTGDKHHVEASKALTN